MKVSKIFSLDLELIDKIKDEKNASHLVNSLLVAHYNSKAQAVENLTPEQLDEALRLRKQLDEAAKGLREMGL